MKKLLSVLLCAALLCLVATAASASGWAIYPSLLKSLEADDTFPVRITSKVVYDGATDADCDVLTLEIANNTDTDIVAVTIGLAPHTEDNIYAQALISSSGSSSSEDLKKLQSTTSRISIQAGGTGKLNLKVNHSAFTGLRAIVASYETADGTTVENGNADLWAIVALGGVVCTSGSETADKVAADDSFGMAVTMTIVAENASETNVYPDEMAFVVKNVSGQTVTDFTIRILGFDANGYYSKAKIGLFERCSFTMSQYH